MNLEHGKSIKDISFYVNDEMETIAVGHNNVDDLVVVHEGDTVWVSVWTNYKLTSQFNVKHLHSISFGE